MAKKAQAVPRDNPPQPPERTPPQTSTFTVIGWLASTFALVPLVMAAHGDGRIYLWSGLAMILAGGILLVIGHVRQNFD